MGAAAPSVHQGASGQLLWLAALGAVGFAVPAIGSGWLRLPRDVYLVPYLAAVAVLAWAYVRWDATPVRAELRRRWAWGLLAAAGAGALASVGALRGLAASGPRGLWAAWQVLWLGMLYGGADGLLLTVLPVWIVWRLMRADRSEAGWLRLLGAGVLGLLASLAVTAAYHLGYVEFRGAAVAMPLVGNTLVTLAYLLTRSPLAPLGAHMILHVATVLVAVDTAATLPPHT
jgi:hypothetical protein